MAFETDVDINFLNKLILDDEYSAYNYIKMCQWLQKNDGWFKNESLNVKSE